MLKNLQVAAIIMCVLSYASAGTVSIGTVNARGEMRVDSNNVKGNATLFDGSVVETGQATADLLLNKGVNKGVEIKLSTSSRGTLFNDHLVLQQGESELAASSPFELQAYGLRVKSNEANSRGVVSLKSGDTVEVASLSGSFGVTNDHGVLLANVRPGRVVSFAMQAKANPNVFSGTGLVSFENGTYYLTTEENVKYILTCRDIRKYVGDKVVVVSGTIEGAAGQAGGSLCVKSMEINGSSGNGWSGLSTGTKWLIAGIIVGGGAGAGIAIYEVNQPSTPASK
jgi:hypothetical protein